jgi:hypothetical protein
MLLKTRGLQTTNFKVNLSVVDSSVGRALSFSHEGPRFKSRQGHLIVWLLICDLIDCKMMSINGLSVYVDG